MTWGEYTLDRYAIFLMNTSSQWLFTSFCRLIGFVCAPILYGGCLYQMSPIDFIRKPPVWLKAMAKYECTACAAPNFAFELITKKMTPADMNGLDLSHVIGMLCGAEPIKPEVVAMFMKVCKSSTIVALIYAEPDLLI